MRFALGFACGALACAMAYVLPVMRTFREEYL